MSTGRLEAEVYIYISKASLVSALAKVFVSKQLTLKSSAISRTRELPDKEHSRPLVTMESADSEVDGSGRESDATSCNNTAGGSGGPEHLRLVRELLRWVLKELPGRKYNSELRFTLWKCGKCILDER